SSVPAEHFRQLPFNAWVRTAHGAIRLRLRPLLRRAILGFVIILDHCASATRGGSEALRPQGTGVTLSSAEMEVPAIPPLGAHPGAGRRPARTADLCPRCIEEESWRLE